MNTDMSITGDNTPPIVTQSDASSKKVQGSAVSETLNDAADKISSVVFDLKNIETAFVKSPELYSGASTTLGGLGSFLYGNYTTGTFSMFMGGVTIYKALNETSEAKGKGLEKIIMNTGATLKIAEDVNKKTQEKCNKVNEHLKEITSKGEELAHILKDIGEIATGEFDDLNEQLDALKDKGAEALDLGEKATEELKASLLHNQATVMNYEEAKEAIKGIGEDLKTDNNLEKRLPKYVKRLKIVQNDLTAAANSANASSQCVMNAMSFQRQMHDAYNDIQTGQAKILENLQTQFNVINAETGKARVELTDILKQKDVIAKDINTIKENCGIQQNLLNQCMKNMEDASKEINNLNIKLSVVIGALVGLTTVTLGLAFPFIIVASVVGGLAYYYGDTVTGKINNLLFGPAKANFTDTTNKDNLVIFAYNQRSGGLWGKISGKSPELSNKEGMVNIRIKEGLELTFPFNIKDIDPISPVDGIKINKVLSDNLKNKSITPEECLAVIDKLQTISLGDASFQRRGFFTTAVLDLVKQEAHSLILEKAGEDIKSKKAKIKDLEDAEKTKEVEIKAKEEKQKKVEDKLDKMKKIRKTR